MNLQSDFSTDVQGRRFSDVRKDGRVDFTEVLAFLDDPTHQEEMEQAQREGKPALAGVVAGLEALPSVDHFFRHVDAEETRRFRQAVGVAVRMVMERRGWFRTGQKGYLGQRAKVTPGKSKPGAQYNATGPSRWFNRAEHYRPQAKLQFEDRPPTGAEVTPRPVPMRALSADEKREYAERARKCLAALQRIGTEAERQETLDYLMKALAETRRAEGRPF